MAERTETGRVQIPQDCELPEARLGKSSIQEVYCVCSMYKQMGFLFFMFNPVGQ